MNLLSTSPRITAEVGGPQLKIRIGAAASETLAVRKHPKDRKSALLIKSGSTAVQIFGAKGKGPYTIAWREGAGGKRFRAMRSDLAKAKQFAEDKAKVLANGELTMLDFGPADHASYKRAIELLHPTGKSLELAISEYTQCVQMLGEDSLVEAVKQFRASRANIVPKLCPDIVTEFLERKNQNSFGKKVGNRWRRTLKQQLERFAGYFKVPLNLVTSQGIDAWLVSMKVGGRTRKNYRGAVAELIAYGKAMHYVRTDWNQLDHVPVPNCQPITKAIYTPGRLAALLAATRDNMIPFTVLMAFAGIRHEEMNTEDGAGEARREAVLDWREINFKLKLIRILPEVSKTGEERFVKMTDNLVEWLLPHARSSGPVCTVANTSNALYRAKKKARIPAGKNETRNALRKSWESYSNALKQAKDVSGEAGHSQEVSRRHYVKDQMEADAQAWFAIKPESNQTFLFAAFK